MNPMIQRLLATLATLVLSACVGAVGAPGESDPGSGNVNNPDTPPELREPDENFSLGKRWLDDTAGLNPMRRLTAAQVRYSVLDLTGVDLDASMLPSDAERGGFVTFASGQVTSETQLRTFMNAAEFVAGQVALPNIVDCSSYDAGCVDRLLDGFGRLAFRGTLTSEERQSYRDVFQAASALGGEGALRYVIRGILSAPRFLYRTHSQDDHLGYATAEKLSFFLWESTPDDALLRAAESGELDALDARMTWVDLMLQDQKGERMVDAFHRQWLHLGKLQDLTPDADRFPEYSPALAASYEQEALLVARTEFFDPAGTLEGLLTTRTTQVDAPLANLYGYPAPASGFQETSVGDDPRAGILMVGGTLARLSSGRRSEPIYRGDFILEQVLCRDLELPGDLNVMLPEPDPALTYRQQLEEMTSPAYCAQCHEFINPLGLALDAFDALGRYRPELDGSAIDTAVELSGLGELDGSYADGPELLQGIAQSDMTMECYAEKWFEFAIGRARDPEIDMVDFDQILAAFRAENGNLQALVQNIVRSPAF